MLTMIVECDAHKRQAEQKNRLFARYSGLARRLRANIDRYYHESPDKGDKAVRILERTVELKRRQIERVPLAM